MQLAEDSAGGVDIHTLRPGTTVVVETHNSRYRFVVLFDPWAVLVKGGAVFPDDTIVRLAGATTGGSAIKLGWILLGWRIELHLGSVCIRSSPVRSVKVEDVAPRQLAQVVW
jgi:hypothetical protein